MNAQEFLDKNQSLSCKQLAELLEVSSGTITKMKTSPSRVQSLALDALHEQERKNNLIEIDVREWFDKLNGNSYFNAYVYYKGETYFLPFQYGYGSHCETVALELLVEKGLIDGTIRTWDLREKYNINFRTNKEEVSRKSDLFDGRLVNGKGY